MTTRYAILLRHGDYRQKPETPSALQPYGLTESGKQQALDAGRELARMAEDQGWRLSPEVFSSRQQRAWQTATLMCQSLSEASGLTLSVSEDEALAERGVGALANLTLAEIEQVLADDPRHAPPPGDWKSDSHYKLPVQGAESLMEAGERVAAFLREKLGEPDERHPGANARIFVGHGAALRHAAHHLGVLEFEEIRRLSMYHAKPVVLKFGADGTWSHHCGAWKQRRSLETAMD
ncbi:histidine phosphatase family protein [Roseibium marinum]|uniref:phosphoglycerate mutase (2,3-diphosphoglycerate-dependent) n=1 Tax=Roseibium marinum TaxID=281252 RepID=A0A2S3ULC1_9HYPH|nr:histidine phosphatase family protein [Roseibium marinum]POF28353.1 2,3-bisphosphoglycerate-dependent phosphoglycerate mutase [Roseibium marinum]